MDKVKTLYIPKGYIQCKEYENVVYIKSDFDDEALGKIWRSYDFEKAEEKLYEMQCQLSKATYKKNKSLMNELQNKICFSSEAKMLAVRKVSEISKASAGIDKVMWRKDSDKMRASIMLNNGEYKAKPLKQFILKDPKTYKERRVGIPTIFDRAMEVLYSYALEPIAEVTADRKSFAFRKGRSSQQAHAHIMSCLTDIDAPEWIFITDIQSYYDTISHKWLLENIPIDKTILKEFLKCGFVFNGELFNKEAGISLGSNLSTILGNMTLDGLQLRLYKLQGEKIYDYKNGFCLRFADDICTTARTEKEAYKFKDEVISFARERGLKISETKTKIVNIKDGFDFLARSYYKIDGMIRCIPSEKAVKKFEKEIEELIFNNAENWSQGKLIQNINYKISGFTTYHKVEEAIGVFKHLDVVINALLLKMMKQLYKNMTKEQIIKKFWKTDSLGRYIFALPNNKEKCVICMEDTILTIEEKIDHSKNIFLDREYFEELDQNKEIKNCTGKYKKVWERQEGKCFICSQEIKVGQEKDIIFKRCSKDRTIRNIAYVHNFCKDAMIEYGYVENDDINTINLKEVLLDIESEKEDNITKENDGRYEKLISYFHNCKKNNVSLTFKEIEKILNFKLCNSAYKYRSYFTKKDNGMISEAWLSQGYEIKNLDMKKQKIDFTKVSFKRNKIVIPKFLYRVDLQPELIEETNRFFAHIQEKYRLK